MNNPLATLVARFGFRISTLDAHRAGIDPNVLAFAVHEGKAKIERVHAFCVAGRVCVTYIVFA